jgi:hypothetical protein
MNDVTAEIFGVFLEFVYKDRCRGECYPFSLRARRCANVLDLASIESQWEGSVEPSGAIWSTPTGPSMPQRPIIDDIER